MANRDSRTHNSLFTFSTALGSDFINLVRRLSKTCLRVLFSNCHTRALLERHARANDCRAMGYRSDTGRSGGIDAVPDQHTTVCFLLSAVGLSEGGNARE